MIIVKLQGGLGNQMFQYAFGKHLALKHNTELKLDLSTLFDRKPHKEFFVFREYDLDVFKLNVEFANTEDVQALSKRSEVPLVNKVLNKLSGTRDVVVKEPHFQFSKECYRADKNSYIDGYWQSYKYFEDIKEVLKKNDFAFKEAPSEVARQMAEKVTNSNSVCVNVRRTDFTVSDYHGTCSPEYYYKAGSHIKERIGITPHFFVFSDDMEWCHENIKLDGSVTYVGHEYKGTKFKDYLWLMSLCKHFIIPNSTFAWWAVWFSNSADKIVVAPKQWFTHETIITSDLIPVDWIRL